MNILFFDTETTGFSNSNLPVDDPAQPHIVQIAAQLCREDGAIVGGFSFIVDPGISHGITIPTRAAEVHGITDEVAAALGMSVEFALSAFLHLYQRAGLVVAHNIKFDRAIVETAIARHYKRPMPLRKPLFCTMEAATPIIALPPTDRMRAAGFTKSKPPKLAEAIRHFFDEPLDGAHDAMVDVIACRRVFFRLREMGVEVTV